MEHMEVVSENEKIIEKMAKELFRLTILAEEERITKVEHNSTPDFSFRREFFQKAIKNLM